MDASHDTVHAQTEMHGSRRAYLIGFLLSAVLTAVPFWLAMIGALAPTLAATAIIACAVVQIVVHTVCFLHVNTSSEGGWTLMAYAFAAVIVLIVIAGSLWIMHHLDLNMMRLMETPAV